MKYELSGEFDKALKIYADNKIHSDIERVKMLKKEIYKEIRDGEKNLYMHNVADLFSKMPWFLYIYIYYIFIFCL